MPIFQFIFHLAAGGIAAVIINYLSDVLPETRSFSKPVCRKCEQPFSTIDYIVARKCSQCGEKRPLKLIVFLCSILFSVMVYIFPLPGFPYWAAIPMQIFLGMILAIDYEHHVVLIQTTFAGILLFLIYGIFLNGLSKTLLGGLGGLLIMFVFYFLGILFSKVTELIRKQKIDEVAFGFGDVCLGTVLGLLAGWPAIAAAIVVCMVGFVAFSFIYVSVMIVLKQYRAFSTTLPFTFFLVLGAIVVFYL